MTTPNDVRTAIDAARQEAHLIVDRSFDALLLRLSVVSATPQGTPVYKEEPSEEDCRDPRNKIGHNLSPEGVEVLFRLLDKGAGYNSAGRKLSINPSAVRSRKKEWMASGAQNRQRLFIPYLDTIA